MNGKLIITDLVFGKKDYGDIIKMNENTIYSERQKLFEQKLEEFCEGMPKEKKDKFISDITLLQMGIEGAACEEHFNAGFKLGMTLAAQSFLS